MKYDLAALKPIAAIVFLTVITAAGLFYFKSKDSPELTVVKDIPAKIIEVSDIDRADLAANDLVSEEIEANDLVAEKIEANDFIAEATKYTEVFLPTYRPKAKPKSKLKKPAVVENSRQSKSQSKIRSKKSSKKNNKNIYTSGKWKGLPIIMDWTDKPIDGSELTPYGYRDR